MYCIAVDAGGTKTLFSLFNENSEVIYKIELGTCHHMQVGYEGLYNIITEGINKVMSNHYVKVERDELIISLGLAGYGNNLEVRKQIENSVEKACNGIEYIIHNDVEIAMKGALAGNDGIVVIAGTGSIAFSMNKGITKRVGGWGYNIGDEGSAYWIGNKTLNTFSKKADGRLPKGKLYDLIMDKFNLKDDYEMISYVNNELKMKREKIAKLSLICSQAAKYGDKEAIEIFDNAAKELSKLINLLLDDFEQDQVDVSYIGGVFKAEDIIKLPLAKYIDKKGLLKNPIYSPEYGAYLYAKDMQKKENHN
jgi:N-acetylglucosamine kinase-like BadF-type ATPase